MCPLMPILQNRQIEKGRSGLDASCSFSGNSWLGCSLMRELCLASRHYYYSGLKEKLCIFHSCCMFSCKCRYALDPIISAIACCISHVCRKKQQLVLDRWIMHKVVHLYIAIASLQVHACLSGSADVSAYVCSCPAFCRA